MPEVKDSLVPNIAQNTEYNMLMTSLHLSVSKHCLDEHFTLVWANPYYYELIGYPKEEYEQTFHNQCDLFFTKNKEDWEIIGEKVRSALAAGRAGYECVARMRHKSGHMMWVRLVGTFTDEKMNGLPLVYTVMTDISDLMRVKREQTVTYNHMPGFIAKFKITKDGFEFMDANERYVHVFGRRSGFADSEANKEVIAQNHAAMLRGEPVNFAVCAKDPAGRDSWFQVSGECVDWADGCPVYQVVYIDITELTLQRRLQQETNEQLRKLAFVDSVTQGHNRTCFDVLAGSVLRSAPPNTYALVSLDLQKFKLVNDLYGVEAGDRLLHYVHQILTEHLSADEYVGRVAADNFNLLLRVGAWGDAEERLYRIAAALNHFNENDAHKHYITLTAGIYIVDDPALSLTLIRGRANVARQKVKASAFSGLCGCRTYTHEDRERLTREKEMEDRMHDALARREFVVYLQPKQSLLDGTVAGAEALVRWKDPVRGFVPPDQFIGFFEKNGFIVDLDLYVFEQVCRWQAQWAKRGLKSMPISVNMSRAHLVRPDFIAPYESIRRRLGVDPKLLEIELTESLAFENPRALVAAVAVLHRFNYRCSLDDFGSGYSSLNILRDLNVDVIKLDKAFFSSRGADNRRERDVIFSVLDLARRLRVSTVAEGVETAQQADFLRSSPCDLLQGYVFSRPLPVEEFEKLAFPAPRDAAEETIKV